MKPWWKVLGVARGSDRATIRRAYAQKLRVTNPEDDPQGFMVLRQAYEAALDWVDYNDNWDADEDAVGTMAFAAAGSTRVPADADDGFPEEPDSPPAAPDPEAVARAADHDELWRRLDALKAGLHGPWHGDAATLQTRFDAILSAPALIEIATRDSIEYWLASLLADTVPRSDAVLMRAVAAFGWEDERNHSPAIRAILNRIDEWRFIGLLERGEHNLSPAWRALTRRARAGWRRRIDTLRPGIAGQVRRLLGIADYQLPGIAHSFDPAAVAWWRDFTARPHFGFTDLLLLLAGAAGAVLLARFASVPILYAAVSAGAFLLGVVIRIRYIAPWRLRREMAEEDSPPPGRLWRFGLWSVAAVAAIALPIDAWSAAAIAGMALAGALWISAADGVQREGHFFWIWLIGLGALGALSGTAFFAMTGPQQTVLATLVFTGGLIALSARWTLAEMLAPRPRVFALTGVALLVGGAIARSILTPAPPPLLHWGAAAIAGLVLLDGLRAAVGRSRASALATLLSWGLWIAMAAAAIVSTPASERALTSPDPMVRLEQREPAFAALKQGNPGLHSAIALLVRQEADGAKTSAEVSREIDRLANRAYFERLPTAPAALIAAEMTIRLERLREYRARDVQRCASGGEDGKPGKVSEKLRERHYRHGLRVAGSRPADAADLAAGREIAGDEMLRLATRGDAGRAAWLQRAMAGSDAAAKCDARIAFLEVLVAQPDADIAKTMRPALTARAEPDSAKKK